MKSARLAFAAMATVTIAALGTPMVTEAATFNGLPTQINGKMVTISGSSMDEIRSKLKDYGINFDNYNLNCNPEYPGFPGIPVFPELPEFPGITNPELPGIEIPGVEVPGQPGEGEEGSEPGAESSYADQVVKLVNAERVKNGLSPLTISKSVESAANVRSKEIVNTFSHTRPNGSNFSTALSEQGVSYMGAGENIAWGQKSPEEVMQSWMNSAGHRANILNGKFTKIGVGHYRNSNGTSYWTQLFTY